MTQFEEPFDADSPETAWKSDTKEQERSMQISLTPDELCAMARSRERLNARVIAGVTVVSLFLAGAFLYNVYRIDQPWIRLGQAWTLGVVVFLFGSAWERGRRRTGTSEPCAEFLEKQHAERRSGYLHLRRRMFLFIPGIAASEWGQRSIGSSRASLWLFAGTAAALVLAWFLFGKAAEKAARDGEEIRRGILR
jgi:multisubunit Na+/H+ antiporter MnhB subunit